MVRKLADTMGVSLETLVRIITTVITASVMTGILYAKMDSGLASLDKRVGRIEGFMDSVTVESFIKGKK